MSTSYGELLQKMMDRVPSNVDKREGSIIYDALAPCAYFLAQQNFQIENFFDLIFPDKAEGEYLDRAVAAYGIVRKEAVAAVRKMETSAAVTIGSRWGINELVYQVTDILEENVYEVTCETSGDIGNQYSGAMLPIFGGIVNITAELSDILTEGSDRETDESLRERFFIKVRLPATSGNAYHYQQWALEVPGTGAAKVFPLDKGPGTVSILVVDNNREISSTLPAEVAAYIETVRPIGATVTVESPQPITIDITANVQLDGSRGISEVKADFEEAVKVFLQKTVFTTYRISYAKLSSILLDIPGVEDFEGFLLNSGTGNIILGEKQIPVKGTVTLSEVSVIGTD